jgi:cyclopropane fatty-acyl-phospholipid synthase-like methyltransferase
MSQTWQEIWNRKLATGPLDLASLVKLDGFDTGAGRIDVEDWQAYCAIIGRKLGLRDGDSVFEVGCGAGAFLYGLRQLRPLEVGGIDYASNLIGASR